MKFIKTKSIYTILSFFVLFSMNIKGQTQIDKLRCGTGTVPLSEEDQRQEDAYQKHKLLKKTNAIKKTIQQEAIALYVVFKFKGEQDPVVTDMEAVKSFFLQNSFGIYTLDYVITPVIELPKTREEYIDTRLYYEKDLVEAFETLGYYRKDYDYYLKRSHSGKPFIQDILGNSGGTTIQVLTESVGVMCHEIGHALYNASGFKYTTLHHANLWFGDNDQTIGPGESQEYGNGFAVMGGTQLLDFGLPHKINMEWLLPEDIHSVTESGTYRIYAHDRGVNQNGRKYGIKVEQVVNPIPLFEDFYYYIEYKTKKKGIFDGVLILTESTRTEHTILFDMHPSEHEVTGEYHGVKDAHLAVGDSFKDAGSKLTIHTVASGGEGDDAWMDVEIIFGEVETLSIESIQDISLKIFPNPIKNNELNIQLANNEVINNVALFDALGRIVFYQEELDRTNQVIIKPNLSKGIYILKIRTNTGSKSPKRIIIK